MIALSRSDLRLLIDACELADPHDDIVMPIDAVSTAILSLRIWLDSDPAGDIINIELPKSTWADIGTLWEVGSEMMEMNFLDFDMISWAVAEGMVLG